MLASVMDSDLCEVRGLTPSGVAWSTCLDPAMAADYDIEVPDASDTADRIMAWSGEARCAVDRGALVDVLTKESDPFVEDLFFELIDACGLPTQSVLEEPSASLD